MADISSLNGYNLKDAQARSDVSTINGKIPSGASPSNNMATASDITGLQDNINANTALISESIWGESGKNVLALPLEYVKQTNTSGTWSGNVYTINGGTVTFDTDANGYVTNIKFNGTFSADTTVATNAFDKEVHVFKDGEYILNGISSGSASTYSLLLNYKATSSGSETGLVTLYDGDSASKTINSAWYLKLYLVIKAGTYTNVSVKPMLRDADIIDDTYEPYHESVKDTLRDGEVIEGKNLLENKALSTTSNGVTYTVNSNKSVGLNSTATATDIYWITKDLKGILEVGKTYTLSGCPANGGDGYRLDLRYIDAGGSNPLKQDTGSGNTFEFTSEMNNHDAIGVCIRVGNGTNVSGKTFYPMICTQEEYETDPTYEPYYIPLKDSMFPRSEQAVLGAKNFNDDVSTYTFVKSTARTYRFHIDKDLNVGDKISVLFNISDVSGFVTPSNKFGVRIGSNPVLATDVYPDITQSKVRLEYTITTASVKSNANNAVYMFIGNAEDASATITISNLMVILASDTDDTYAPFAMTNRELTEKVSNVDMSKGISSAGTYTDLNDVKTSGIYAVFGSALNKPSDVSTIINGTLIVTHKTLLDDVTQTLINGNEGTIYVRTYATATGWSSWYKFTGTVVS